MRHPEEAFRTVLGQPFYVVDVLVAPVVAAAGIAFRIFVGEDGSHRVEDGLGHVVFRRDQLDAFALTPTFGRQDTEDVVVLLLQTHAVLPPCLTAGPRHTRRTRPGIPEDRISPASVSMRAGTRPVPRSPYLAVSAQERF